MSTGEVTRKGLQVACARTNQYRKAKDRVYEDVDGKLEKFYESIDEDSQPMLTMQWSLPDPDTGKVKTGELVFNILGPDSIRKIVPMIEKMHGPKPRKKRAGDGDPPKETKPAETKPAETKPAETKPKETKPKETKPAKEPPKPESKTVDDGLFDDDD
jgi:hypothetical protein